MRYLRSLHTGSISIGRNVSQREINQALERLFCNRWTLFACKLTIGAVSAYDIYLTVKYFDSLPCYELNPIGRWLMDLDYGPNASTGHLECSVKQLAAFITSKFAGNFLALSVIEMLASWKQTLASSVALPIALLQTMLLYFLVYGVYD